MKRPVVLGLFVLLCLAQLWVTGSGIARYERTLGEGVVYRFESAPMDPEDPFRGRYVRLSFVAEETALPMPESQRRSRKVYAVLGADDRGFAVFTELLEEAPAQGDYLYVDAWPARVENDVVARLTLPFNRYFMEESMAPEVTAKNKLGVPSFSKSCRLSLTFGCGTMATLSP